MTDHAVILYIYVMDVHTLCNMQQVCDQLHGMLLIYSLLHPAIDQIYVRDLIRQIIYRKEIERIDVPIKIRSRACSKCSACTQSKPSEAARNAA